jgi:hypothetical protein
MATRFGKLPFDDSPRVKVFRAVDDILRSDPQLQRVLSKPGAFRSWRGDAEDKLPFAQTQGVALRITPVPEAESWWYPGASKGDLVIQFEILVNGLALDDVENLFFAITRALRPQEDVLGTANTVRKKLTDAGAMTGLVLFTDPAHDARPEAGSDGQFHPVGACRLEVKTY